MALSGAAPKKINLKGNIMNDSGKKYPKAVKSIYIAGKDSEEGRKVEFDSSESNGRPKLSKALRGFDQEVRAFHLAAGEFFKTYIEQHDASNAQTRDGALKQFGKNTVKAHKAAFNVYKDNSKAMDYSPTEIHDKVVEYLEDLEDEYTDKED